MKIAVSYVDGKIFPHFGKTESFKIYQIEDRKIVSSEVVSTNGAGHEALAGMLAEQGVYAVICGGLGEGAQHALSDAGIDVCSGADGDADTAVEAYLRGELVSAGTNCDHHEEQEESACGCGGGCGDEGGCGGGCGGCGGGCGGGEPLFEGKNVTKTCRVHYCGTLNDGTQFDSSYDRGEPLEFVCGMGMMIPGFDKAVAEMEVGEIVNVHLMPEEAYGEMNLNAIFTVEIADLPGAEDLNVGDHVYLTNQMGQSFPVKVTEKEGTSITFDANHELAGKELNFKIELVEIK